MVAKVSQMMAFEVRAFVKYLGEKGEILMRLLCHHEKIIVIHKQYFFHIYFIFIMYEYIVNVFQF